MSSFRSQAAPPGQWQQLRLALLFRPRRCRASLLALFLASACFHAFPSSAAVEQAPAVPQTPHIFPNYSGITIPPNIAPLNFRIEEPGRRFRVQFSSAKGDPIEISSRTGKIQVSPSAWHGLLSANAGQGLLCNVSAEDSAGRWHRFAPFTNWIAREPIDNYLGYRLLKPLYNVYVNLGIYQRDLEGFQQRPILENSNCGGHCLNCHTFLNRRADTFALNVRTSNGSSHPMLLIQSNQVSRVDKTMGYLSWHPTGRLLAFSANKLSLFSHTVGETRDVYDANSNLGIYRVDSNTVYSPPAIALTNRNETWPAWSPDGRYLYYCSAAPLPLKNFRDIRYDLMRVSYDIDRDEWGEPETLVSAQETGLSAGQPKISPDGRSLLFCLSDWGNFPVYQTSSDLYLMDLQTREYRWLRINSDQADSWHCWSSNSRWVVFSSKRLDGLFARPFFSYVDAQGCFHPPFLLPQQDPAFYDSYLKTINVPELFQGPVIVKEAELARAIGTPIRILTPKNLGPAPPAPSVGSEGGEGQSGYRQQRE
jgi:hypothetical protein